MPSRDTPSFAPAQDLGVWERATTFKKSWTMREPRGMDIVLTSTSSKKNMRIGIIFRGHGQGDPVATPFVEKLTKALNWALQEYSTNPAQPHAFYSKPSWSQERMFIFEDRVREDGTIRTDVPNRTDRPGHPQGPRLDALIELVPGDASLVRVAHEAPIFQIGCENVQNAPELLEAVTQIAWEAANGGTPGRSSFVTVRPDSISSSLNRHARSVKAWAPEISTLLD